jgi:hypothetical protein
MAAGVTSKLFEMSDMLKVLEGWEAAITQRLLREGSGYAPVLNLPTITNRRILRQQRV